MKCRIQTELTYLIGNKIRTEIVTHIIKAKYYTIMIDKTPDTSHKGKWMLIYIFIHYICVCVCERECMMQNTFLNVPNHLILLKLALWRASYLRIKIRFPKAD